MISYLHFTFIFPLPVLYASSIFFFPSIVPPVGKSGPFTILNISSKRTIWFIYSVTVASITSPKLCVGILVAYPALIPVEPFTSKLGNLQGSTVGSTLVSS